jgi:hypothetical protein
MSVLNRVWDTQAGPGFVSWKTTSPDEGGTHYPGPGTFGVHTSDYCVEAEVGEQGFVRPVPLSLAAPRGTVQGLWHLDGDLLDKSANGIDLTNTGTEWYTPSPVPGVRGTHLGGTGLTSPAGAASDPLRILTNVTMECLIYPHSFVTALSGAVAGFGGDAGSTPQNFLYSLNLGQGTNELQYFHQDNVSGAHFVNTRAYLAPGSWYHIAFTKQAGHYTGGNLVRVYLNGRLVGRATLALPFDGSAARFFVGDAIGIARDYPGSVASVRVIDDVLRPEHILASARATLPASSRP